MFTVNDAFQKDRLIPLALLGIAASFMVSRVHPPHALPRVGEPLRPLGINAASIRAGLERDLGSLEPKGRTNPDGSEVWGYPTGSGLEELIEVHVKDGRVIREVLRPSSRISAKALTDS